MRLLIPGKGTTEADVKRLRRLLTMTMVINYNSQGNVSDTFHFACDVLSLSLGYCRAMVRDLATRIESMRPHHILAHSHGGLILLLALRRLRDTSFIKRIDLIGSVVLLPPMNGIQIHHHYHRTDYILNDWRIRHLPMRTPRRKDKVRFYTCTLQNAHCIEAYYWLFRRLALL